MNIQATGIHILDQLSNLVHGINEQDFIKPAKTLSNSTIGQHLRHTLEFFICFQQGIKGGIINYDKRAHDNTIEIDKHIALATINQIKKFVNSGYSTTALTLEVSYDYAKEEFTSVPTNYTRELVYNIEHAVHHMAIIKIGIHEVAPYIILPPDFGIAASTIRHNESKVAVVVRS